MSTVEVDALLSNLKRLISRLEEIQPEKVR
jgi:hypothetical protein